METLPKEIKDRLRELFLWAAECYKQWRKESFGKENGYICFPVDEPEVQKHYPALREFFLNSGFDKSKLFLDALEGKGRQTPPPSEDDLLSRGIEHLLEWAGVSLSSPFSKQNVHQFIEEFERGIGKRPVELTFIPVFGIYADNGLWRNERFKLCHNVEFGFLNQVDRELLAVEAKQTGEVIGAPSGFVNMIPSLCLVVSRPLHVDRNVVKAGIDSAIQNFRVFCSGIWAADIDIPFQFTGYKSPLSPWQYVGGGHPREFEDWKGRRSIHDFEWKLMEKYWPELHPKVLENYAVTASRLTRSVTRGHWTDKIVDIAIALEGLFDGKHALNFRYQTILPRIVGEDFDKSKLLYGVIRELMDLRNNIVHGHTLESDKELAEKFKKMSENELNTHIEEYRRTVRSFFTIQLLNKELRTSEGHNDVLLGKQLKIVRNPALT